jgi:hypothetical protein
VHLADQGQLAGPVVVGDQPISPRSSYDVVVVRGGPSATVAITDGAKIGVLEIAAGAIATTAVIPHRLTTLAAGSVDGDGLDDLIVLDGTEVLYLRNEGDGQFGAPQFAVDLSGNPERIVLGSFNEDRHLDLAAALVNELGVAQLNVALGHGDGTFGAPQSYGLAGSGANIVVVDVLGDGRDGIMHITNGIVYEWARAR